MSLAILLEDLNPELPLSNSVKVVFILFLVAALFAALRRSPSDLARIQRAIRNVPKSEVATAPEQQQVKVIGTLSYVGEPLRAPLSARPCACYEVIVTVDAREDDGPQVVRDMAHSDFWLTDGTGTALVRTKDAIVDIHRDTNRRSGWGHDATPELEAFLHKHGKASTDRAFGITLNKPLIYEEGVLGAGEKVAVVGYATWEADLGSTAAPGDSRYGRPKRLVLQANGDQMPLCVTDKPGLLY